MRNRCFKHAASLMFIFTLLLSSWTGNSVQQAAAADALTVSEAIALGNNGSSATVEGYIIGHATGSNAAKFQAPFANDFNVLIADATSEQDKTKLVNVQLTASYRGDYGLQTNPDLIGTKVRVTGTLAAYNNFPGLRSPSAITLATDDNGTPGDGDGGGNGDGDGGDNDG
ncbi:DUF6359 domain-containing protein, partial [Paenibacillus massiliensis]|uniref:DUF6359 domain-containing protein n=1 Tax=Paenibacillus massiliensis TaxID=225917 RepID=UPI0004719C80